MNHFGIVIWCPEVGIRDPNPIPIPKSFAANPKSRIFKTESQISNFSNSILNLNPKSRFFQNQSQSWFQSRISGLELGFGRYRRDLNPECRPRWCLRWEVLSHFRNKLKVDLRKCSGLFDHVVGDRGFNWNRFFCHVISNGAQPKANEIDLGSEIDFDFSNWTRDLIGSI